MAKKVKLRSTGSRHFYTTMKNEKKAEKMEMMKFDPVIRQHVLYKEEKI